MINFTIAASGAALPRSEKVALVHIYRGARAIARIFDIAVANFDSSNNGTTFTHQRPPTTPASRQDDVPNRARPHLRLDHRGCIRRAA